MVGRWSDGWGNLNENSLTMCRLKRLMGWILDSYISHPSPHGSCLQHKDFPI